MSTEPNRVLAETPPEAPREAPPWRLTHALNAKLAELRAKGFRVLWIESSREDLTQLAIEGGENAIELDADPELDRAWYGDVEIRLSTERMLTWVFLEGEVEGEVSAHIVGPPDPPR
jgi:hypothetical protein